MAPTAPTACCPTCQQPSAHVHQYHTRLVRDLPWADHEVAALQKAGEFVERWREPILNYFVRHTSSDMVEGLNNKIKVLKRQAFGFRNDSHFRLRVLMACEGRQLAH